MLDNNSMLREETDKLNIQLKTKGRPPAGSVHIPGPGVAETIDDQFKAEVFYCRETVI